MIFVALRKLTTVFVSMVFLVSTGVAEASLCTVNCALAGLTRSQHEHIHYLQHGQVRDSAMRMTMPMTSQGGQHQQTDMDMSTQSVGNERDIGSRRCAGHTDSVGLASGTKFVLTRIVDLHANLAITAADFRSSVAITGLSILHGSLPPPGAAQTRSAPIRV